MNVMTVLFKDKFFEEGADLPEGRKVGDRVPATQIPCIDWGVEGAALISVLNETTIAIFPLAELESAIVQLGVGGFEDAGETSGPIEDTDSGESVDAEGAGSDSGIVLPFKPDFAGSGESGSASDEPDEG